MNKKAGSQITTQQCGSFHLTRKTDYGLLLLAKLAENDSTESLSVKKIAETNDIPFSFLQKIARELQKAGLIKSSRGKYGGQTLAKSPKNISIKDVIEALEGPVSIANCTNPAKTVACRCSANCGIKNGIAKMNQELITSLNSKNLSQLLT